jgi:hypothetical protein
MKEERNHPDKIRGYFHLQNDTHPLPSFQLLDMQWHLNRIIAMCGASEIYDSDNDDDDDHCDAGAVYSPTGIES